MSTKKVTKAEVKEICKFYLENGWRATIGHFSLSPTQASEIIPDTVRAKFKANEKAAKKAAQAERKAERKAAKAAAKAGKTEKAPKKRATTEVDSEPRVKRAYRKKSAEEKAAAKGKPGRKKKVTPDDTGATLDFLLAWRTANGGSEVRLDDVIISLTEQLRAAS